MKKYLFLLLIAACFFCLYAGSCDQTELRGTIVTDHKTVAQGETVRLAMKIPPELDDIYRLRWEINPKDMGVIKYKQYPVQWGEKKYGKEDRVAFFTAEKLGSCDIYVSGFYKQTNPQPIAEIALEIVEPERVIVGDTNLCSILLSGVTKPIKDFQTAEDDQYTTVTLTSREHWERNRLPKKVLELERKGYVCTPYPEEIDYPDPEGDMLIQPEVKKAIWHCELFYEDYKHLPAEGVEEKDSLAAQGYTCKKINCLGEDKKETFIWFCYKP